MQAQEPVAVHLSEKNGLPDKEFYSVFEDTKGFIWLCADKGLFRYDGKAYKKYNNIEQRGLSVFGVQQDSIKRIWCNNISGQFFYVKGNQLILFVDLGKQLKGELADFIVKKKYLWVFTKSNIFKINIQTKQMTSIVKSENYFGVPFKNNNTIYYQDEDSISSITPNNKLQNVVATHLPVRDNKGILTGYGKSTIFKIGKDLFLMQNRSLKNTFFQFNVAKKSFQKIKGFEAITNNRIYTIFENGNELWLGTKSGVWVYKYSNNEFYIKKHFLKIKILLKYLKTRIIIIG